MTFKVDANANAVNYAHVAGGGGETLGAGVLNVTGANAIVDWVVIELRSASNPATVIATKSALIQVDGDIVSTDGISPVSFTGVASGTNAYVAVRHRNHLGVMTAAAQVLTSTTPLINFTSPSTSTYSYPVGNLLRSSAPQAESGGLKMMWAGNTDGDNAVIFQGPNNDSNGVFYHVLTDPANTNYFVNFISNNVYARADINMNGEVIFQGDRNEVDSLFFAVLTHTDNAVSYFLNFIIYQQLP
jgi:hypothetical protein